MGKASKWFRSLLRFKKPDSNPDPTHKPLKNKWSFVQSRKEKSPSVPISTNENDTDTSKHAIAVAAATAAVAEAAVAAAQAAAAVVKLTSSGRSNTSAGGGGASYGSREVRAAVKIQSHFRAYLSRRALRALKGLVKLQALVRGHQVRKQTADIMRRMQALLRAQARARAVRALISESPHSNFKSSHFNHQGPRTLDKQDHVSWMRSVKHRQSTRTVGPTDDERSDKILEVDTGKPHIMSKNQTLPRSSPLSTGFDRNTHSCSTTRNSISRQTGLSQSSEEVQSLSPLKFTQDVDEPHFCTADNSPQCYSASSMGGKSKRGGPFTPTKSECSRSCLSGYSDHPNYMSYTESSKAKARSYSAPKQRPQYERSSSTKRYSVYAYGESRPITTHKGSSLHSHFTNKAYPGSGRLDSLGMPIRGDAVGYRY